MLKGAMKKYDRYYTLVDDSCDILYITMFLDPRFKKIVLENELKDGAEKIVAAMQQQLETQYPAARHEPQPPAISKESGPSTRKTIVSEVMSKIKAKSQKSPDKSSDIARYLDSDVVEFDEKKRDWIYSWWRGLMQMNIHVWQQLHVITRPSQQQRLTSRDCSIVVEIFQDCEDGV